MDSMDQIYRKYAPLVWRYLMSLTQDADVSEELCQETFYQVLRSIESYDNSSSLSTWLCGVAHNVYRTWKRGSDSPNRAIKEFQEKGAASVAPSAEEIALEELNEEELKEIFGRLPETYRQVVWLRILDQLSFREIGDMLGHTETWARVTFYRAKEKLVPMLEPWRNDIG